MKVGHLNPVTVAELIRALQKLPLDARVVVAAGVDEIEPSDGTDVDLDRLGERLVLERQLPSRTLKIVPPGDDPTAYFQDDDGTEVSKVVVIPRRWIGDC